jgi:hypothetical protein
MQTRHVAPEPRRRRIVTTKDPDLDTGAYEVAPRDVAAELERLGEELLTAADKLGLDV